MVVWRKEILLLWLLTLSISCIVPSTGFKALQAQPVCVNAFTRTCPNRPRAVIQFQKNDRTCPSQRVTADQQHVGASQHAVHSKEVKLAIGVHDPDPQTDAEREFELNRGAAVDTLLADYPTIFTRACDFSIFHSQVMLEDSQGFHVEGLRAYKAFFSIVPTLVNVCFSRCETSAVLMDKYGLDKSRIKIRWRLDLFPRFSGPSSDIFRFLDSNGDGVISSSEYFDSQSRIIRQSSSPKVEPVVVEGISVYKLNAKAEIIEHKIEVTNPSSAAPLAILRELLPVRRSYVSIPNAIATMNTPPPAVVTSPAALAVAGGAAAVRRGGEREGGAEEWETSWQHLQGAQGLKATVDVKEKGGAGPMRAGKQWAAKNLPKTCKEDYDCNPGGYNWPLRCVDVVIAKICIDPDDWKGGGLGAHAATPDDLAMEPIPVRVEDGWIRFA
mmetsp:Transcript_55078/g.112600  ORF Transcript_55078/g.112600 Transcript_55078/m.112600 type:complete len:441 (+) Transcript_55078:93-1415(+)|eukprot:CAMPEP_0181317580 /NCGR_PEP_ID=MMETSP1101-20121128/16547_1 /TAXON_ID=46948 /ORGANISM="Rhodomonas abbreviata, Strain Caron Lab Isolate" /LENGTH=440 /DNA_ID=CAMNT_0023424989 /DNA_START=77 /DNA_END=1399 /DNA_ORIENTATION=+